MFLFIVCTSSFHLELLENLDQIDVSFYQFPILYDRNLWTYLELNEIMCILTLLKLMLNTNESIN